MRAREREARARELLETVSREYADLRCTNYDSLSVVRSTAKRESISVRRRGRNVGRLLLDLNVLLVDQEEDRPALEAALSGAGYHPRGPITTPAEPGEVIARFTIGTGPSWMGESLIVQHLPPRPMSEATIGLYLPGSQTLVVAADGFAEPVRRLLDLAGLAVRDVVQRLPSDTDPRLRRVVDRDGSRWGRSTVSTPGRPLSSGERLISRSLTAPAAALVSREVREAINAQMSVPRLKHPSGPNTLPTLTFLRSVSVAMSDIALPSNWDASWESAEGLVPALAPMAAAAHLQEAQDDWWSALPGSSSLTRSEVQWAAWWTAGVNYDEALPVAQSLYGRRIVSKSRVDDVYMTLRQEDWHRFVVATALVVAATSFSLDPHAEGRRELPCFMCGQPTSIADLVPWVLKLEKVWPLCALCQFETRALPENDTTMRRGALAAIRDLVVLAGGIVYPSMLDGLVLRNVITPEQAHLFRMVLPGTEIQSWSEWLREAGVLGEGWRSSRGYVNIATDGHPCRSLFERVVDDFLNASGIGHEVEPPYPYDEELNRFGLRADWRLDDGRLVEAAGLMGDAGYASTIDRKRRLAHRSGMELIVVTPADVDRLPELFQRSATG